jgi:carboxyl-terminal processing protease
LRLPRAALLAGAVAVVVAGIWLGGHPDRLPGPLRDVLVDDQLALDAEVFDTIEDNYFHPVDAAQLQDASIKGMVQELRRRYKDRFSHYFDPSELARFEEVTEGRFSGVGLSVSEVGRGLRVARVFPGSPAERSPIRVGDVIVSVNGHSITGEDADIATARIKGPVGTEVRLGVLRPGTGRTLHVRLERARVEVPVVDSRLRRAGGTRVGYVQLTSFTPGAHDQLRDALERVERRRARGVVLDLRGNGGGLLKEAVLTASLFLDEGERVVSTDARSEGRRVYEAVGDPLPRLPLVVLINRDTASAAEILTAALQEHGAATVVGTRSFGKGVFQQVIDLPNGGALDLTVGEYFTPNGTSLAGKGIRPEVRARDRPATDADEGLRRALQVMGGELRPHGGRSGDGR